MKDPDPKLRTDARRNRDRILQAGRELFGESSDVPMYEVARRAGVGQATLYRHFPDRYSLIDAITRAELTGLAELAAQVHGRPDGLTVLLSDLSLRLVRLRGLAEVIRAESLDANQGSRREDVGTLFLEPLSTAIAAGTIRADLELKDVYRMMAMIEGAVVDVPDRAKRSAAAERAQELLLNGLRPPTTTRGER